MKGRHAGAGNGLESGCGAPHARGIDPRPAAAIEARLRTWALMVPDLWQP